MIRPQQRLPHRVARGCADGTQILRHDQSWVGGAQFRVENGIVQADVWHDHSIVVVVVAAGLR